MSIPDALLSYGHLITFKPGEEKTYPPNLFEILLGLGDPHISEVEDIIDDPTNFYDLIERILKGFPLLEMLLSGNEFQRDDEINVLVSLKLRTVVTDNITPLAQIPLITQAEQDELNSFIEYIGASDSSSGEWHLLVQDNY